jgi:hypothetical protein
MSKLTEKVNEVDSKNFEKSVLENANLQIIKIRIFSLDNDDGLMPILRLQ